MQSSCLALMAAQGEIAAPDAAIFADTQAEPASVYTWLDWLEKQLPYPVHRVTKGDLAADQLQLRTSKKTGNIYCKNSIPAFVERKGDGGWLLGRRCTGDYKIDPLIKLQRHLAEIPRGCKEIRVKTWIGISTDEAHRMKPSREKWIEHTWPLIDLRMSRQDCKNWFADNGHPEPPRSACTFCPFHSNAEWKRLHDEEPDDFAAAVEFEQKLQAKLRQCTGSAKLSGDAFLHSSKRPLGEIDFDTIAHPELDLWANECEGMCGV